MSAFDAVDGSSTGIAMCLASPQVSSHGIASGFQRIKNVADRLDGKIVCDY
jgi:hypothetical protein